MNVSSTALVDVSSPVEEVASWWQKKTLHLNVFSSTKLNGTLRVPFVKIINFRSIKENLESVVRIAVLCRNTTQQSAEDKSVIAEIIAVAIINTINTIVIITLWQPYKIAELRNDRCNLWKNVYTWRR